MTTSRKNLSREQIEALLALGNWDCIEGDEWYGFKRRGLDGVAYFDEGFPEDGIGYNATYNLEPGHDPDDHTMQWRTIDAVGWNKLLLIAEYMLEQDIL